MDSTKKAYVYEVFNDIDDRVYVGKADDVEERWGEHQAAAAHPLYTAMVITGSQHFSVRLVSEHPTAQDAHAAELKRIKELSFEGRFLFNKCGVPNTQERRPRWADKLYWNRTHKVWFGRWQDADGRYRTKQVPCSIVEYDDAFSWFRMWWDQTQLF